jgi:hypothetical protein
VHTLQKNAGTQFDPLLVSIFAQCVANGEGLCAGDSAADSLRKLAVAIQSNQSIQQVVVGGKS